MSAAARKARGWAAMGWPERMALFRAQGAEGRMALLRRMGAADRGAVWSRLTSEERCALIAHVGAPPEGVSERIHAAPARGRLEPWMPRGVMLGPDGEGREIDVGYRGWTAARVADVFDRMEARRPAKARRAGPLFTPGQVAMARDYAALTERCAASGVKGVSLEVMADRSGGGDGGFMDAVVADHERLRALHRRIGDGVALRVRRVRPGARGSRHGIKDRYLVDQVCLAGWSLSRVLEACGWSVKAQTREAARVALAAALDRMQGYR